MKHFSTRDAARVLETSEDKVRFYARAGLLETQQDQEGRLVFDFQDLLLLRTTTGLLDSGVPARHMRRIGDAADYQLDISGRGEGTQIQHAHLFAPRSQLIHQMPADEAAAARDQIQPRQDASPNKCGLPCAGSRRSSQTQALCASSR